MASDSTNSDGDTEQTLQDYLDLLLLATKDKPELQGWRAGEERRRQPIINYTSFQFNVSDGGRELSSTVTPNATSSVRQPSLVNQQALKVASVIASEHSVLIEKRRFPQTGMSWQVADAVQPSRTGEQKPLQPSQQQKPVAAGKLRENEYPGWARQPFECLLLGIEGLTLAVPLVALAAIHPIAGVLVKLPIANPWLIGLMPLKEGYLRLVDTARMVEFNKTKANEEKAAVQQSYNYVVSIKGMDWGLAVDTVTSTVTLDLNDVCWRSPLSKTPWLAGTVTGRDCCLLDVDQLATILASPTVG